VQSPREPGRQQPQHTAVADLTALTEAGWQIVYRDAQGTQLRRPKRWNGWVIMAIVVLPVLALFVDARLWLGELFFLALAVVDYTTAKDELLHLRADETRPATSASE
jgi:hypothetical protein